MPTAHHYSYKYDCGGQVQKRVHVRSCFWYITLWVFMKFFLDGTSASQLKTFQLKQKSNIPSVRQLQWLTLKSVYRNNLVHIISLVVIAHESLISQSLETCIKNVLGLG